MACPRPSTWPVRDLVARPDNVLSKLAACAVRAVEPSSSAAIWATLRKVFIAHNGGLGQCVEADLNISFDCNCPFLAISVVINLGGKPRGQAMFPR